MHSARSSAATQYASSGCFYTWNEPEYSRGAVLDTLVRWELTTEGEQVRLLLVHRHLAGTTLTQFGAGWHAVLDSLDAHLQGRESRSIEAMFAELEPAYESRFSA
jgi:hypothetical protein